MLYDKFILPQDQIYMCGHSLGPMLTNVSDIIAKTLSDHAQLAVSGWNASDWIDLPSLLGAKIAKLIAANALEVIVCDSTVINLYKALSAALKMQPGRNTILTTADIFPANLYIAKGLTKVKVVEEHEILQSLDESIAVVMLSHVNYRSAQILDMEAINRAAHKQGILTVWDLSHSMGIVPIDLTSCDVDFAVGCTYKYLSAGPGSPAFIYANHKHHQQMQSPIQGWMGHASPFAFSENYVAHGVKKFMGGTPPILSMKSLEAALEIFNVNLIMQAHKLAMQYSKSLISALQNLGLQVYAPILRGGHVAFLHKNAYSISRALLKAGITCDYRAPDLIRLCINPLYISKTDIEACVYKLQEIIDKKLYMQPIYAKIQKVT